MIVGKKIIVFLLSNRHFIQLFLVCVLLCGVTFFLGNHFLFFDNNSLYVLISSILFKVRFIYYFFSSHPQYFLILFVLISSYTVEPPLSTPSVNSTTSITFLSVVCSSFWGLLVYLRSVCALFPVVFSSLSLHFLLWLKSSYNILEIMLKSTDASLCSLYLLENFSCFPLFKNC